MEFPFEIDHTCAPTPSLAEQWPGITVLTAAALVGASNGSSPRHRQAIAAASVIDNLGQASAAAQKLAGPITSAMKLLQCPDQRVYVAYEGNTVYGFIKVGRKTLFVHHRGRMVELAPLAVLDFYVDSEYRRQGVGKRLFDCMLECEGAAVSGTSSAGAALSPARLAYDRPSAMFLAFLRRHFGLVDFTPQANNFVVFHKFFTEGPAAGGEEGEGESAAGGRRSGRAGPVAGSVGGRSRRIGEVEGYDALAADVTAAREQLLRAAAESGALRPASTVEMLAASTLSDLGPGGGRPVMRRSTAPWAHTTSGIFPSAASGATFDGVTTLRGRGASAAGEALPTATTRAVASLAASTSREPFGLHPTIGTGSGLGGTASGGLSRVAASLVASRAATAHSEGAGGSGPNEAVLARTIGLGSSSVSGAWQAEAPSSHTLHYGPTGASEAGRRGGSLTCSPAGAVPGQLPPTRRPLPPMPPRLSGLGPDGAPLSIADGPTPPVPASQGGGTGGFRPLRSPHDYRGASAEAPFATENNIPDDMPRRSRSRAAVRG